MESKDTGGGFTLIEGYLRPGTEPPPHVHEREDELFYVLEARWTSMLETKFST
jgi:uncharacterized cupin superfamily protein